MCCKNNVDKTPLRPSDFENGIELWFYGTMIFISRIFDDIRFKVRIYTKIEPGPGLRVVPQQATCILWTISHGLTLT